MGLGGRCTKIDIVGPRTWPESGQTLRSVWNSQQKSGLTWRLSNLMSTNNCMVGEMYEMNTHTNLRYAGSDPSTPKNRTHHKKELTQSDWFHNGFFFVGHPVCYRMSSQINVPQKGSKKRLYQDPTFMWGRCFNVLSEPGGMKGQPDISLGLHSPGGMAWWGKDTWDIWKYKIECWPIWC